MLHGKLHILLLLSMVWWVSAFAADDRNYLNGDILEIEDLTGGKPVSVNAKASQPQMAGFVSDHFYGKGPERDTAASSSIKEISARTKLSSNLKRSPSRSLASFPIKKNNVRRPVLNRRSVRPKFWRIVPHLSNILLGGETAFATSDRALRERIRAEGLRNGRSLTEQEIDQIAEAIQNGEVQGNGGSSGGGGSGGGSGSSGLSESLMGVAAVIAASSAIVSPLADASARKTDASEAAKAAVATTETAADAALYQAGAQADVAKMQSVIARDINKNNQDQTTLRQAMQLQSLSEQRRSNLALDSMKLMREQRLELEKIKLNKEMTKATAQIASERLRMQAMLDSQQAIFRRDSTNSRFYSAAGRAAPSKTAVTASAGSLGVAKKARRPALGTRTATPISLSTVVKRRAIASTGIAAVPNDSLRKAPAEKALTHSDVDSD